MGLDETLPDVDTNGHDTTDNTAISIVAHEQIMFYNYPNPFYAGTTISYYLENSGHVSLKVYNMSGQLVSVLIDDFQNAGTHNIYWNTSDATNQLASGIYYSELITDTNTSMIRMLRIE